MALSNRSPSWSWKIVFLYFCAIMPDIVNGDSIHTIEDVYKFLTETGYISRGGTNQYYADNADVTTALKSFQKFYGLTDISGNINNETLAAMNKPRCGLPDIYITTNTIDFSRHKRYLAYGGWGRTHLTYNVERYSQKLSPSDVDAALSKAFKIYEDVTVLTFERIYDRNPDILFNFYEAGYDHGDGRPFAGQGRFLAHAFFPFNEQFRGDVHFDESEDWTFLSNVGVNLVGVAAHEIGHSLGLAHTNVIKAIMYPIYFNDYKEIKLHADDIAGIESLYGNGMTTLPHTRTPEIHGANSPTVPNLCKESMDAIIATDDGTLIILKGSYVWLVTEEGTKKGYPKLISQDWSGLQNNLDTGTQLKNTRFWTGDALGKLLFVKGKSVWRYDMEQHLDAGFPQDINTMLSMVAYKLNKIVAMFEIRTNGDIYLFGEKDMYIFNWSGIVQGPYKIQAVFAKAPPDIAAVFQWKDDIIYMFSNSGMIYKFDPYTFQLMDTPWSWFNPTIDQIDWLSCSNNLIAGPSKSGSFEIMMDMILLMSSLFLGSIPFLCN